MAKCIITGCDLQVKSGGMWCHGDLWVEGDCYIFNACVEGGEVLWVYSEYDEGGRLLTIDYGEYFERRGVIVVSKACAYLNSQAREYIHDN